MQVLHYLRKLSKLPVRLEELEKTGIGRTINGLRKADGYVGEEATLLMAKWKKSVLKQMVTEDLPEEKSDPENEDPGNNSCISPSPMENDITAELVKSEYDPSFSKVSIDEDRKSKPEIKNKVRLITIKKEGSHDRKRKHSEESRDRNSKKVKVEENSEVNSLEEAIKVEPIDIGNTDLEERRESVDKRKKDESDKKSLKKDHEKRHHKSSKHREEKRRDSKHRDEKHRSHHEKKQESDKYDKHRRDKKSKIRDKEANHSKDVDRKSSKEFSEAEGSRKKSTSRDDSYKNDEASGECKLSFNTRKEYHFLWL